ncbi:CLUMA_CG004419, isoform A [Clunio marinus]|uniref:CLUMA_CG004419, isoform A n=1 Tax=Clunio marinus TaxID=568069 RepID=A0A1J1HRP4_9DIPT|nr:CLUMA_CG004419, isoform A [Clunio marinus]
MTIFIEIVSVCRLKEIDLSPQKNPRLTLSTKNSMKMRAAAAVKHHKSYRLQMKLILPNTKKDN